MTDFQYIDNELKSLREQFSKARAKGQITESKQHLINQCFFIASLLQEINTTPFNFYKKFTRKRYLYDIAIDIYNTN